MIYVGENRIYGIYLGETELSGMYAGELQLYPMGAFQGLKVTPKEIRFASTGETVSIKVKSSELWMVSTHETWINLSTYQGDAGETVITATADPIGDSDRNGTIYFQSEHYQFNLEVSQINVQFVEYVFSDLAKNDNHTNCVYIATTRIFNEASREWKWRVVGKKYSSLATPNIAGGTSTTSTVCNPRVISYNNSTLYLDYPNQTYRTSTSNYKIKQGDVFDMTVGARYVINNITGERVISGNYPTLVIDESDQPLGVELTHIKVNTYQLWKGDELVFDGHAAVKDGVAGLYDNITGQLFTVPAGKNIYFE